MQRAIVFTEDEQYLLTGLKMACLFELINAGLKQGHSTNKAVYSAIEGAFVRFKYTPSLWDADTANQMKMLSRFNLNFARVMQNGNEDFQSFVRQLIIRKISVYSLPVEILRGVEPLH